MENEKKLDENLNQDNIDNSFRQINENLNNLKKSLSKIEKKSKKGFLKINSKLDSLIQTLKEKKLGLTQERKN